MAQTPVIRDEQAAPALSDSPQRWWLLALLFAGSFALAFGVAGGVLVAGILAYLFLINEQVTVEQVEDARR